MANINTPQTPPDGSSVATLNAFVALTTAQQALNTATVNVANAIQADQQAVIQAQIAAASAAQPSS